jgi:hypothetical protein
MINRSVIGCQGELKIAEGRPGSCRNTQKLRKYRFYVKGGTDSEFKGEEIRAARKSKSLYPGKGKNYQGYLVVDDELRPLLIGSTLDQRLGPFSWMPEPGFLGKYDFVFLGEKESGVLTRIPIKVMIKPKFEK